MPRYKVIWTQSITYTGVIEAPNAATAQDEVYDAIGEESELATIVEFTDSDSSIEGAWVGQEIEE